MALWTWWTGDALPTLAALDGFEAGSTRDVAALAALAGLAPDEVIGRLEAGNRCYVARMGGEAAGYGWVADAGAAIGELGVAFALDVDDRYLWDFATLPAWRGRGLYPRLLQAILRAEREGRFWIINAPENAASGRGIARAGFRPVGDLSFGRAEAAVVAAAGAEERARLGVRLLGVPLLAAGGEPVVSPCWCCVIGARERGEAAVCWPPRGVGAACGCGAPGSGSDAGCDRSAAR